MNAVHQAVQRSDPGGRGNVLIPAVEVAQAKVGGRYNLHPRGAIEVTDIRQMLLKDAKVAAIKRSGFPNRDALGRYLKASSNELVFLVEFRYLGDVAVNTPPTHVPDADGLCSLAEKLHKMDARSSRGPWACRTLALIAEQPATRAAELAAALGWEVAPFKANVRKLKALGLTESLEVGYRITGRGQQVLGEL